MLSDPEVDATEAGVESGDVPLGVGVGSARTHESTLLRR